jgi:hypothetical protein
MLQTEAVEKIKTHILCAITFSENRTFCMEKYGRARQATDDSIARRMRIACWIIKATDTHSEYVIFISSPRQKC